MVYLFLALFLIVSLICICLAIIIKIEPLYKENGEINKKAVFLFKLLCICGVLAVTFAAIAIIIAIGNSVG